MHNHDLVSLCQLETVWVEAASLPLQALATRHPLGAASLRGHAQCQLVDFSEKGTEKVRHI